MILDYKNSKLIIETSNVKEGNVTWRSPSNIAIIKYWGKHGRQIPQNPSISFTLENAYTETSLSYKPKSGIDNGVIDLDFYFDGQINDTFKEKVLIFLNSIIDIFPFLRQLQLSIKSKNSFPHSAGIASSASSMSALALCICSLENRFFNTLESKIDFLQKASFVARLGSGSASRSVYPSIAMWGKFGEIKNSSDLFAIPYEKKIHEVFKSFRDDILIVSNSEKSVSSRAGHNLMENNIYANNRYKQARSRLHSLLHALEIGDVERFGNIAENEALTLHALMMVSNPSFILLKPNTLKLIEKIRAYRIRTKNPLYFSLDAGPNLHLLYPDSFQNEVQHFIKTELIQYCEEGEWISDFVGNGPKEF